MSISSIMAISQSGMQAQTRRVEAAASNIANALTPDYTRLNASLSSTANGGVEARLARDADTSGGGSQPDLLSDMTTLMTAESTFKANAAVFETGADMWELLSTIVKDD
ncbi:flagellar basal body protein [Rhizobium helianthi]|uniref:Flagellar basal body protein n=1 Tax=Rhizobium helianthi TaxID=1132695 RepID=A0ABW4LZ09_9HYPH